MTTIDIFRIMKVQRKCVHVQFSNFSMNIVLSTLFARYIFILTIYIYIYIYIVMIKFIFVNELSRLRPCSTIVTEPTDHK